MNLLPLDCNAEILDYLRDDEKSLYSIIRVNRAWCQLAIPLLWNRPFKVKRKASIIKILISCLSEEDKISILEKEIDYCIELNQAPPLFDYPYYIRALDYRYLESSIENWILQLGAPSKDIGLVLFNLLGNLIFSRSRGLLILTLRHYDYYYCKFGKHYTSVKDILSFKHLERALEQLENLEIGLYSEPRENCDVICDSMSDFFSALSKYSKNIQKATIEILLDSSETDKVTKVANSFADFIKSQTKLRNLEVNQSLGGTFTNSLSESLNFLKFNDLKNVHSLLPALSACERLETLEISGHFGVELIEDLHGSVSDLPPINITNLHVYQLEEFESEKYLEMFIVILLNLAQSTLRSVILDYVNVPIIEAILGSSSTLTHLALSMILVDASVFITHLSTFTSLETLIFIQDLNDEEEDDAMFSILPNLASRLPTTLKYLGLWAIMDNATLDKTLCKIKVPIEELDVFKRFDDSDMEAVIKYAQKNPNLKRLGYKKVTPSESKLSKDLLDRASSIIKSIGDTRPIKNAVCL
ncbi:17119_t:CDS:1 [Funneliformis geosporum]|uniref:11176_t:CDS:1 n=1 Tax=Funneliformis geosporum TaxID=1117311 RepID=A0A9W4SG82_9GLOM|nr:17119_t:CDS:1 [Funneliformis geosporum]CAI2167746.1 11176_t:CDS:1 [Funneliformis geosporum]